MAKKGKQDQKDRERAEIEAARKEKLTPKGKQVDKYSATTSAYEHESSRKTRKAVKATMDRLGAGKHRSGVVDTSYTQNREVSWLRFNNRVLDEAFDESVPLFERLKFVEIFGSNLNEWFMIRVGGLSDLASLKHEPVDNKSGLTPSQQLEKIFQILPPLVKRQEEAELALEAELRGRGLNRVTRDTMTEEDNEVVARHFRKNLSPILSPLMVDPRHPFPNLRNGSLPLHPARGRHREPSRQLLRTLSLHEHRHHSRHTQRRRGSRWRGRWRRGGLSSAHAQGTQKAPALATRQARDPRRF